MNELIEIGNKLATLYARRERYKPLDWQLTQEFENRRMALYPQPDGYPGKNAEQRDAARYFVEIDDDELTRIRYDQATMRDKLATIEGELQALEANRRALEWSIRANLINALAYKHVTITSSGYDHEFDDVSDDALLEDAEELAQEAADLGEPYDAEEVQESMDYSETTYFEEELAQEAESDAEAEMQGEYDEQRAAAEEDAMMFDDDMPF